jgi:hypothetical protein
MAETFGAFTTELNAFKLKQSQDPSYDDYSGVNPILGRNLVSVLVTDIFNIFYDPSWVSLTSFFVDIGQFIFTPLVGGMVNASVFVNYEKDSITYQHAGLDKQYLYATSMLFAKDALYSSLGRPDFYGSEAEYVAASDVNKIADLTPSNST